MRTRYPCCGLDRGTGRGDQAGQKATAPALTATQMGDDEMDKVTAGSTPSSRHEGTITAEDAGGNANAFGILKHGETPSGVVPGRGNITAVSTPGHQP
jgi:hypothetical protein